MHVGFSDFDLIPQPKKDSTLLLIPKKKVIVIAGPTASGKTALSIEIAKAIDGEIISADSMQVYREMDIGTAKATIEQRKEVPHHMIDVWDLHDPSNVVRFFEEAHQICKDILRRNKVPIVVGGVGFYIHSFIYGPPKGPPSDPEIREKLEQDFAKFGAELLFEKVTKLDPIYAATITLQDKQKIIRALEIMTLTGKKVSDFPKPSEATILDDFDFHCWFIHYPTSILYPRIEERCEVMLKEGLIIEVETLLDKGLELNHSAAMAIGYRQTIEYLRSSKTDQDYNNFVLAFKRASKHYARRQFTWFRKEPLFQWVDLSSYSLGFVKEWIIRDFEQYGQK